MDWVVERLLACPTFASSMAAQASGQTPCPGYLLHPVRSGRDPAIMVEASEYGDCDDGSVFARRQR